MITTERTSHASNESTDQERKCSEDGEGGCGFPSLFGGLC
jgi:hypothetical protein